MGLQVSHDTKVILAIISIILSTIGLFLLQLFWGIPAVICSAITLFTPTIEMKLELSYKITASFGLYLGILEVIFGILALTGVIKI